MLDKCFGEIDKVTDDHLVVHNASNQVALRQQATEKPDTPVGPDDSRVLRSQTVPAGLDTWVQRLLKSPELMKQVSVEQLQEFGRLELVSEIADPIPAKVYKIEK